MPDKKDIKRRSRSGCLTCRQRHKSCPNSANRPADNGNCDRCLRGGWECVWPEPTQVRPLKKYVRKIGDKKTISTVPPDDLAGNDGSDAGSSSNDFLNSIAVDAPPETLPSLPVPPIVSGLGFAIPPFPPAPSPSFSNTMPLNHLYRSPGQSSYSALGPPPPTAPSPFAFPQSSSRRSSSVTSPIFTSATLAPAHAPTPSATTFGATPTASTSQNPYAELDLLVPLPHLSLKPGEDLSDFFTSLDAELGSWETALAGSNDGNSPNFGLLGPGSTTSETIPLPTEEYSPHASALVRAAATAMTGASGPVVTVARARTHSMAVVQDGTSPSRQETAGEDGGLDPVYDTFNGGFFRSLPKPVRDVVCKNVYNVVVSSELSRNAGMAMVMLYRLRTQQQQQQEDGEGSDPTAVAEQQARLLARSNTFFQRALEHIQTPIPFEAKMVAVLDMQNYQFDQWGAAAANAIVLLGEYFVHEELGLQPALDLTSASVLLSTFAWTDCIRCICIPGRRTVFTYTSLPGDPSPENPSTLITDVSSLASDIQVHLGLPVGLMLCISAITNLAAEADALPDELVKVKAQAIEKAARGWRPPPPDPQDLADGAAYLEKLSSAEMWRHAVVIFLYQVVHKHGSLSRVITEAKQQIVSIGSGLLARHAAAATAAASSAPTTKEEYLGTSADRAVPWFLAGTVSTSTQDRALCKKGLEVCGPLKGYVDNILALEKIWDVVDGRGWGVDWRAVCQAEQRFVGFL